MPTEEVELQRMLLRWMLLPVGAVILLGGLWLWEISRLLATAHWVDHADRVISQAHHVEALLYERESALRTWLTTGEEEPLDRWREDGPELDEALSKLASLVHDEPGQTAAAEEMAAERKAWDSLAHEALLGERTTWRHSQTIDADAATAMAKLRRDTQDFVRAWERVRNERSRSHQHAAKLVVASSAALALLVGVLLAAAARRSLWSLSEAYRRALSRAEDAVRVRDEFMEIASHELRTPLTALNLQLEGLSRVTGDAPILARKVTASLRQTQRLFTLVDNLVDVTRLTGGPPNLAREECDLAEVVNGVVERFRAAGAAVTAATPEEVPGFLDRLRVEQLVTNLVSNAVKFGMQKPVDVRVESHGRFAVVRVHDDGIGIPDEARERIFDRFERAVPARAWNGLGLGLYLARQVAEAHGGSIGVESAPAQGTTFTVLLPLRPPEDDRPRVPAATVH